MPFVLFVFFVVASSFQLMRSFSSAAEVVTNAALEETESAVAEQEARLASDYGCLPENRES